METPLILTLLFATPLVAGWWLFRTVNSPMVRASRQIGYANVALSECRYDDALSHFQSAQELIPRIRDNQVRGQVTYAAEHGIGISWMQQDDPESAHSHLIAAVAQLDDAPQTEVTAAYLYAELASASLSLTQDTEVDAALMQVQTICEHAEASIHSDLADVLSSAAAGATSRNQPALARRLADISITHLGEHDD